MRFVPGTPGRGGDPGHSVVDYIAAPGEINKVALSGTRTSVVIHDDGAAIHPGDGCDAVDANTVRCTDGPGLLYTDLRLGDEADELGPGRPEWFGVSAYGEAGADRLMGGDTLNGGDGDDVLVGADPVPGDEEISGEDSLTGGNGSDVIRGLGGRDEILEEEGTPGNDTIDGGSGRDVVDYQTRRQPLTIDLRRGTGGAPGETDTYSGIENVIGGRGRDVISGDDGPNALDGAGLVRAPAGAGDRMLGRGGDDSLIGADGDDVLEGGSGDDRIDWSLGSDRYIGGPGDDHLEPSLFGDERNEPQEVSCGSGLDTVDDPSPEVTITRDCEWVATDSYEVRVAPLLRPRPAFTAARGRACGLAEIAGAGKTRFRTPRQRIGVRRDASVRFPAGTPSGAGHPVRLYEASTCRGRAELRFLSGFTVAR